MAELFQTDRTSIVRYINNIYKQEELERESTCAKIAQVKTEHAFFCVLMEYRILYNPDHTKRITHNTPCHPDADDSREPNRRERRDGEGGCKPYQQEQQLKTDEVGVILCFVCFTLKSIVQ